MAITIDDFSKIWASTSPLTPYSFSDDNYKQGWNFVGATPPSRQMWDSIQKSNDEKLKYLLDNFADYLPLSGGNITGSLTVVGKDVERVNASGSNYIRYESGLQICWGTGSTSGGIHQYTFPLPFISEPRISLSPTSAENSTGYFCKFADLTTTDFKALTMTANSTYIQLRTHYIAVGFWK